MPLAVPAFACAFDVTDYDEVMASVEGGAGPSTFS